MTDLAADTGIDGYAEGFRRALPLVVELTPKEARNFWAKIRVSGAGQCWPWEGSLNAGGYGYWGYRGRLRRAHRVAWAVANGPLPADLTVDHTCKNRSCCNPGHLRLLTHAENSGDHTVVRRTHCPHGHEFTAGNTYNPPGSPGARMCRSCIAARRQARSVASPARSHARSPAISMTLEERHALWVEEIGRDAADRALVSRRARSKVVGDAS